MIFFFKNTNNLLIPLFDVQISKFISFWIPRDTGFIFLKYKKSSLLANKIIASRLADSVWQPLPKFGESGSRHFKSGSRHLTKDPKTDLKSVRSKLSKTVSFDSVTQKHKVCQLFWCAVSGSGFFKCGRDSQNSISLINDHTLYGRYRQISLFTKESQCPSRFKKI